MGLSPCQSPTPATLCLVQEPSNDHKTDSCHLSASAWLAGRSLEWKDDSVVPGHC